MKLAFILAPIVLVGCASNKDYAAFLAAQQSAAVQQAEAVKARYQAMASVANSGDASSKTAAVMAMAMIQPPQVQLPAPPEDPIFKWASIIMPAVTNLGANYFTYRLGAINSNNAAATTTAAYNTFGSMASAGYNALQGVTNSAFASNTGIATAGFNSTSTIASFIQAPQANVTTNTTNNTDNRQTNTTTNNTTSSSTTSTSNTTNNTTNNTTTTSTTNSNNRTCQGGSGATGGSGGSGTTTGGAGAPGGTGGSATC